jgi:ABC-type glycerol-3-phosphate transport system substrate-binding protein
MKLKKRWMALMLTSIMALSVVGCGNTNTQTPSTTTPNATQSGNTTAEEKVLVVYTARSEELNKAVISEFERETGITVELVTAGTGELLKRAESEKDNPLGDIFGLQTVQCLNHLHTCLCSMFLPKMQICLMDFRYKPDTSLHFQTLRY